MLESLERLGVLDLTHKRFEEHVRGTKLRVVSSIGFKELETTRGIYSYVAGTQWHDLAQT